MSEKVNNIISKAKGEINSENLTNSGTGGILKTGYPKKAVIEYLQDNEQLNYLITNYTDGVTISGEERSSSDKNRNFMCVTDSRVLVIIGGSEQDTTFEYKLKHIIDSEFSSGLLSTDKLKFSAYTREDNKDDVVFPIRDGSNGKDASQYINSNCKGVSTFTSKSRESKTSNKGVHRSQDTASSSRKSSDKAKQKSTRKRKKNKAKQGSTRKRKKDEAKQNSAKKRKKDKVKRELNKIQSKLDDIDNYITNAEFRQAEQLSDEVDSRISSLEQEISRNNLDSLENKMQRVERNHDNQLSKSHVLSEIRNMNPYEFEKLVAEIWKKQGYSAQVTSSSADKGVDVEAIKEDSFETTKHLIQAKRHGENTTVGSKDIQRYASLYLRDEQVDNVFIVTTNRFTSEAKEVAENRDVSTVNGDELYEMLTET